MDRYAVLDQNNVVVNLVVWDGVANWKPPEGHRLEKNEDLCIGDRWDENAKEYVRPLSRLKPPEDEISIAQRKEWYEQSKARLKSSMLFLNGQGVLEV